MKFNDPPLLHRKLVLLKPSAATKALPVINMQNFSFCDHNFICDINIRRQYLLRIQLICRDYGKTFRTDFDVMQHADGSIYHVPSEMAL